MARTSRQKMARAAWALARRQHGVITWWQLRAIGFSRDAIAHRLAIGRLHRLWPGVYAVGRRELSPLGRWKAATLSCGAGYALDGESGLALLGVRNDEGAEIEMAGPAGSGRRLSGIRVRRVAGAEITHHRGIPLLSLPMLFVSVAPLLGRNELEAALNEADKRDLISVSALRAAVVGLSGRRGVGALRSAIDRTTFRYTDSALERAMRSIFRTAGVGLAYQTQERVNGYRVDFYFPALDLVIETDGGRFHRTPFQQANDRLRDQAHTLADTPFLRFTHSQVRFERDYVKWAVAKKVRDLQATSGDSGVPQPV